MPQARLMDSFLMLTLLVSELLSSLPESNVEQYHDPDKMGELEGVVSKRAKWSLMVRIRVCV